MVEPAVNKKEIKSEDKTRKKIREEKLAKALQTNIRLRKQNKKKV